MRIAILATTASLLLSAACCQAADPNEDASSASLGAVEERAIALLSAGRQQEAERLLSDTIAKCSKLSRVLSLIEDSHDKAIALLYSRPGRYRERQRLLFLHAACVRSRFETEEAYYLFDVVVAMDVRTAIGQSALLVRRLDSSKFVQRQEGAVDYYLAQLGKLAEANPEDIAIRWMAAVQCRSWDKNELGVQHYKKLLEVWNPGPVLVHQTYANLLHELGRYDEAVVERRKAVEMEPASWSYDGLANTLHRLGQFKSAYEAHSQAILRDPTCSLYWSNLASTLADEGRLDEAIEICKQSIVLDAKNLRAWRIWSRCLERQGRTADALDKYREVQAIFPDNEEAKSKIAALKKASGE